MFPLWPRKNSVREEKKNRRCPSSISYLFDTLSVSFNWVLILVLGRQGEGSHSRHHANPGLFVFQTLSPYHHDFQCLMSSSLCHHFSREACHPIMHLPQLCVCLCVCVCSHTYMHVVVLSNFLFVCLPVCSCFFFFS